MIEWGNYWWVLPSALGCSWFRGAGLGKAGQEVPGCHQSPVKGLLLHLHPCSDSPVTLWDKKKEFCAQATLCGLVLLPRTFLVCCKNLFFQQQAAWAEWHFWEIWFILPWTICSLNLGSELSKSSCFLKSICILIYRLEVFQTVFYWLYAAAFVLFFLTSVSLFQFTLTVLAILVIDS